MYLFVYVVIKILHFKVLFNDILNTFIYGYMASDTLKRKPAVATL